MGGMKPEPGQVLHFSEDPTITEFVPHVAPTTRADVNNTVRRLLDVRKASFAAMADAVELTGMEYGGITPVGLPASWPVFVDSAVAATPYVIIGSGIRGSKLELPGKALADLPGAQVIEGLGLSS